MKLGIALLALALTACQITPVIGDPETRSLDRYQQCRRAAKDYCADVIRPREAESDACVARSTYECVAARPVEP